MSEKVAPLLIDCQNFSNYPHQARFALPCTMGWLRFSSEQLRTMSIYNKPDPDRPVQWGPGLVFGEKGITVRFYKQSSRVVVTGSSGQSGSPLLATATLTDGSKIKREIDRNNRMVTFEGEFIVSINFDGTQEPIIESICAEGMDIDTTYDDALRHQSDTSDAFRRYYEQPEAAAYIDQYRQIARDLYDAAHNSPPPRQPSDGGGCGGGIGGFFCRSLGGLDLGIRFNWPPDWWCVARKAAMYAIFQYALGVYAADLNLPNVRQMQEEVAVDFLMYTFGVTAETAIRVYGIIGGLYSVYSFVTDCSLIDIT